MNLKEAVELVWDDVADSVYQHPTVHEAVRYARVEQTLDELAYVKEYDERDGTNDHEAYVTLRNASQEDVDRVVAELV